MIVLLNQQLLLILQKKKNDLNIKIPDLKATYDNAEGNDVWYFYFNPNNYALEVYQFFHDEAKNDGEYILLSDIDTIGGINMPKVRAWYTNKEDTYLGTDTLKIKNHLISEMVFKYITLN